MTFIMDLRTIYGACLHKSSDWSLPLICYFTSRNNQLYHKMTDGTLNRLKPWTSVEQVYLLNQVNNNTHFNKIGRTSSLLQIKWPIRANSWMETEPVKNRPKGHVSCWDKSGQKNLSVTLISSLGDLKTQEKHVLAFFASVWSS